MLKEARKRLHFCRNVLRFYRSRININLGARHLARRRSTIRTWVASCHVYGAGVGYSIAYGDGRQHI